MVRPRRLERRLRATLFRFLNRIRSQPSIHAILSTLFFFIALTCAGITRNPDPSPDSFSSPYFKPLLTLIATFLWGLLVLLCGSLRLRVPDLGRGWAGLWAVASYLFFLNFALIMWSSDMFGYAAPLFFLYLSLSEFARHSRLYAVAGISARQWAYLTVMFLVASFLGFRILGLRCWLVA